MTDQTDLTTAQVAAELGKTVSLINRFIRQGRLKATRWGRQWAISRTALDEFKAIKRFSGQPSKNPGK